MAAPTLARRRSQILGLISGRGFPSDKTTFIVVCALCIGDPWVHAVAAMAGAAALRGARTHPTLVGRLPRRRSSDAGRRRRGKKRPGQRTLPGTSTGGGHWPVCGAFHGLRPRHVLLLQPTTLADPQWCARPGFLRRGSDQVQARDNTGSALCRACRPPRARLQPSWRGWPTIAHGPARLLRPAPLLARSTPALGHLRTWQTTRRSGAPSSS